MPRKSPHKCKNCDIMIPAFSVIDGTLVETSHRVYCDACKLIWSKQNTEIICKRCSKIYIRTGYNGHSKTFCKDCVCYFSKIRGKLKFLNYRGGKCFDCGYDKYVESLHFHHLDPKLKVRNINLSSYSNLEKMKKELDSCIILCANCHAKRHWLIGGKTSASKTAQKNKRRAVDYLGGKCLSCDETCIQCLHFHHRDPKTKSFSISSNIRKSFINIKDELDKCDLMCANCHYELHSNQRKWGLKDY